MLAPDIHSLVPVEELTGRLDVLNRLLNLFEPININARGRFDMVDCQHHLIDADQLLFTIRRDLANPLDASCNIMG